MTDEECYLAWFEQIVSRELVNIDELNYIQQAIDANDVEMVTKEEIPAILKLSECKNCKEQIQPSEFIASLDNGQLCSNCE